jgi:tetratricopeptide (TPR) repeat protein
MDEYILRKLNEAEASLQQGNFVSAHFAIRKVLRRDPDNVTALILAAETALREGKRMEAMDVANHLFDLNPAAFDGTRQKRLGHICFENELFDMAAQLFAWVRQKRQHDDLVLYQAGVSLRRLGRMPEAEEWLLECVRHRPEVADPYRQLGHVYKSLGHRDAAIENYRKSIELTADTKGSGYWCLADMKNYTFTEDDVAAMERELAAAPNDMQVSALHFALGWAAEQRQDYASALEHYHRGNAIQGKLKPFRTAQYRHIIADLRSVPADSQQPAAGQEGPAAILIVGLPRSGTTLIEQILSAHPRVQATDELPFLERMALRLEMNGGYSKRLAGLSDADRRLLRQQYVNGARTYLRDESDFFIDKYPGNFLHIGLVKRIMPDAIVIDARRDPRDTAISAYRQLFGQRGEFASSFEGIEAYYEGYLAVMEHWRSLYPGQIITQSYEALVQSPEEEIRSLLQSCGLDDEPACYRFYDNERAVTTPSAAQVSQPMYTSSIGQWRRFEAQAGEAFERLASLAESG